jgi:AraC-like DNA-binding protein
MERYIDYILSFFIGDNKPVFLQCSGIAITKANAFLGGSSLRTEQYYHIVLLDNCFTNLSEGSKTLHFSKHQFILLPPNREFKVGGEFALCKSYYYMIVNKHWIGKITEEFFGTETCLDIIQRNIQAQTTDIVNRIETELTKRQPGYEAMTRHYLSILVTQMLRGVEAEGTNSIVGVNGITKACEYIAAYYNSNISIDELARVANASKYHFIRRFSQATGYTPHTYIAMFRLQRSAKLLAETDSSVSEIGRLCGFLSASHFSNAYKRYFLITPSEYRIKNRNIPTV